MTVFLERVILAILTALALFLVLGSNPMHFNWPQRIGSLLVILVLAGLVSWGINRLNKKKAPSTETKVKEYRIFVPVKPEDLMKIYKDNTEIQASKLAASYIGKWIQVSGTVSEVTTNIGYNHDTVHVTLNLRDEPFLPYFVLGFPSKQWLERLQILPRGHRITANGQIEKIGSHGLTLENCELVETAAT